MNYDPNRVIIFDTTLRDGEQSPGHSMTTSEKLDVACALESLRVDVIEAGFACSSPGDFEAIDTIARTVREPAVCSLARCVESDIKAAAEALRHAKNKRIHVFIATSPIHREFKLRASKEEVITRAISGVRYARKFTDNVEFSAEDAFRTEPDFLVEVVTRTIEAGATTINLPDTVGYATPDEYAAMIRDVRSRVPNIKRAIISTHCHNDLGLAVANSLAGVQAGARQVECTINGIGERAGNAALEEIVMALRTRRDVYGPVSSIDTTKLVQTSRTVAGVTGSHVQRNKAIVGRNAFAHESGIHQHGMLANPETYEIMRPEDVGFTSFRLDG